MVSIKPEDAQWMAHALRTAERARGLTSPNPAVGCVLVKQEKLIAAACTASGGRPHAETEALRLAGEQARGATAYVTLEPCAHSGKTPPCAEALITAGITRVVIAATDPNPETNGKGIALLQAAGIEVVTGILELEAQKLHAGFLSRITHGRPIITLKTATSADGFMAAQHTNPRWLTNDLSRKMGHVLRSKHEAILTGSGTVLADNPALTCRLPGLEHTSPIRIILDRQLRTPPESLIYDTSAVPSWLVTTAESLYNNPATPSAYESRNVRLITLSQETFLPELMTTLASEGINSLLVEAGPTLLHAFLQSGMADTLYWFHAPLALKERGEALFAPEPWISGWKRQETREFGCDRLVIFQN